MQVAGLNPNYDWWHYSRIRYEGKFIAQNAASRRIIKWGLEINRRIKAGEL